MRDPYVYPNSEVLINKFDIRDADKLQEMEKSIYIEKCHLPLPAGRFDYAHLKTIHKHFFEDLYDWAGQERTVNIAKGRSYFGNHEFIEKSLEKIFLALAHDNYLRDLSLETFIAKLAHYFNEINAAHPFREGNGRTLRAFCDMLAEQAGYYLDWSRVEQQTYLEANILGFNGQNKSMENILKNICSKITNEKKLNYTTHKAFGKSIENQLRKTGKIKR